MNVLVRGLLLAALAAAMGCGGSKSADEGKDEARASTGGSGASASASKFDQGPRAGESAANEELAERGEKLFQEKGCSACHAFGKRSAGPDLAGVSMRRTARWMENQILHPDVMVKEDPISRAMFGEFALQMPNQGLTPEEAKAVIEYFKHQDQEADED
ncbi:MAG TPA: cytochrome c [Candidatus Eisenbacteria bacterium]|nr:cytochrome c [Candidatus Eisenbacteria bacterium]